MKTTIEQAKTDLRNEPEPTVVEVGQIPVRGCDFAPTLPDIDPAFDLRVVKHAGEPAILALSIAGRAECAELSRADVLAGIAMFLRAERTMRLADRAAEFEAKYAANPPAPRTDEEIYAEAEALMARLDEAKARAATRTPAEAEIVELRGALRSAREVLAEVETRIAELQGGN